MASGRLSSVSVFLMQAPYLFLNVRTICTGRCHARRELCTVCTRSYWGDAVIRLDLGALTTSLFFFANGLAGNLVEDICTLRRQSLQIVRNICGREVRGRASLLSNATLLSPLRVEHLDTHVVLHLVVGDSLFTIGTNRCVLRGFSALSCRCVGIDDALRLCIRTCSFLKSARPLALCL